MLELKRESMSVFIHNARAEIVGLWDDLILGDDDRAEFTAFIDGKSWSCVRIDVFQANLLSR